MTASETPRVLIVEDEADLRRSTAEYLALHGFVVDEAGDALGLARALERARPDLVLLDLRLPGEDGLSILRRLRGSDDLPVIMVTAMGDPIDRVVGLEMGADDYVVKPFELRELLARIRSVLRRTPAAGIATPVQAEGPPLVTIGRARLDREARRLYDGDGCEVPLTAMEFDLLEVFIRRPNRVLSRDQLVELAHNGTWTPLDRAIDIRIARLRKKIEPDPSQPTVIRTVRGIGYMFVP